MDSPRPSTPPASLPPPDWTGREFGGRYLIESKLGEGGIGIVYRAMDQKSGTAVALKVLRDNFARTRLQRRFAREAKALAALRHPNIVSILDVDVADETPYLVMELLDGKTLSEQLAEQRPLPIEVACAIMRELLEALAYVHGQGLVHRDLKPGNVFLQDQPDGPPRVKLLDFGLAKFLDAEAANEQATVTRSGDIFGTLGYMPPEQAVGDTTDTRADVYSAACVFFEMIAGRRPFVGESTQLLQRQLTLAPPSLMEVCPERIAAPELDTFFRIAIASKPNDRHPDAPALLAAFDALPKPPARAPTLEEIAALAVAPADATTPLPIGLAPTVFNHSSARRDSRSSHSLDAANGPIARFTRGVRDLVRGVLVAGAWVLSAVVLFLVLIGGAMLYLLFGSEHAQQQQALREAMPPTLRDAITESPATTPNSASAGTKPTLQKAAVPTTRDDTDSKRLAAGPAVANAAIANAAEATTPDEATTAGAADELAPAQGEEVAPVLAPRTGPREPAKNPWRGAIPSTLKKLRAHAQKHWRGDERAVSWLRRYNREHPEDPRGHLVLAMLFDNREWYSDVLTQYAFAYQKAPSSRGDSSMLRNLIAIARLEATTVRASDLLAEIYGEEARGALTRAVSSAAGDPDTQARLQRVLARVAP